MSKLDKYVDDILTPTAQDVKFLKARIKRIRKVLTDNSNPAPMEVTLGGSLVKGTMLKHKIDGDLICVYNREPDIGRNWSRLAGLVHDTLQTNFPEIDVEPAGKLAIHFKTQYEDQNGKTKSVNIDLVPCYYVNSPAVMKDHTGSNLYEAITTIWHARYLQCYRDKPFYTAAVRLLKDWKNEHDVPLKGIHLELITADIYDCQIENLDTIREVDDVLKLCFQNILYTMNGEPVLPGNWKYCKYEGYKERYDVPVIVDPANPASNLLGELTPEAVKKIRRKVNKTMENLNLRNYNAIFNNKNQITTENYFFQ